MKKQLISQALESHLSELVSMSDQIYDFAEPGMEEIQSSRLLTEYLKAKGFEVECGIAGLPQPSGLYTSRAAVVRPLAFWQNMML